MRPVPGQARLSIGTAAITWFVCFVASGVITAVILLVSGNTEIPSDEQPMWVFAVRATATWIPVLLCLRYVSRRFGVGKFADDFGLSFRSSDLVGIPVGVLSNLVLLELIYLPLRSVFPDTFARAEVEKPARSLLERADTGWLVVVIVIVVVGAPLFEELLYRGLIFRAIEGRIATYLAVIASAFWFAFVHGQPVQFPGLFVFGIVLAYCAFRSRRLGLGILAHFAFNATTVVTLLAKQN